MSGTLLIVEDDSDVCEAIVDTLQILPVKILTAADGKIALDLLRSQTVDAVLSDINMPHMTGLDLLGQMRMLGFETPFVVLSAYGDRRNTIKALQMGAMDFLDKPFDVKHLLEVVGRAIEIGIKTNELNKDMQAMVKEKNLSPGDAEKIFRLQRQLMIMRYDRQSYGSKKKAG